MTQKQESPAGDGRAFGYLAGRLDASKDTQTVSTAQGLAGTRFERQVVRVHALGPRPLGELLIEIASHTGQSSFIAHRLEEYARLDRDILRALGADRFPPMPLEVVR